MDEAFRLEPSENQAIFEREIEPALLLVTSEVTKPKAVLIAAQTGAGKSGLLKKTQEELQENAIFVNTDELRRHHPRYEESGRLGDLESAARTQHEASECALTHQKSYFHGDRSSPIILLVTTSLPKTRKRRNGGKNEYAGQERIGAPDAVAIPGGGLERQDRDHQRCSCSHWLSPQVRDDGVKKTATTAPDAARASNDIRRGGEERAGADMECGKPDLCQAACTLSSGIY
ncbi:MAG: zeta toxin family protein [Candidatus Obscuribacterales bacterium]|nr:zeta toxin family protein [Candidatus Obscuribacterales bacterium]